MRYRSTSVLLVGLIALMVLVFGCGGGAAAVGGPTVAATPQSASAGTPATGGNSQATPSGPPLDWQGHTPLHVRRHLETASAPYTPSLLRTAYGFVGDGSGQTIGIVDAYGSPTIQNDLDTFCAAFTGLTTTTVDIVTQSSGGTGGTTHGGGHGHGHGPKSIHSAVNAGWALETSLDVEWAHAIAPNAKIVLSVANSASLSDLLAAVDNAVAAGAKVVSMSWGGGEFKSEASYDSHFEVPGVSFFASSGDSGKGAEWPSSSIYVTSVGGTTLTVDPNGNWLSETAWSGSGGGQSRYISEPSYQDGWTPNNTHNRCTPDVALDADPNTGVAVYDSTSYSGQTGWWQVGGTSLSSPVWAAATALVNASSTSWSASGTNHALYGILTAPTSSTDYHDITSGSNGYQAGTGYDMVTGLGTPRFGALSSALSSYSP